MRKKCVLLSVLLFLAITLIFPGTVHAASKNKIKQIKLPNSVLVAKGTTSRLEPTVKPSGISSADLKWSSSNKKGATINKKGVIKGITEGTSVITVSARDGSGTDEHHVYICERNTQPASY